MAFRECPRLLLLLLLTLTLAKIRVPPRCNVSRVKSSFGMSVSLLSTSFAAMFPDNVGRFVIDGVVNAHDWYAGEQPMQLF